MATSKPINLFWSILAAAILISTLSAADDQPPERTNNQSRESASNQTTLVIGLSHASIQPPETANNCSPESVSNQKSPELVMYIKPQVSDRFGVRLFHRCMMRGVLSSWPELDFSCRYSCDEIQYRYQKTGNLSEDYVEALRIYHNYNQTDVDIDICKLSRIHCPDRIKALNARCTSTDIKSGAYGIFCCSPRDIELGRHGC